MTLVISLATGMALLNHDGTGLSGVHHMHHLAPIAYLKSGLCLNLSIKIEIFVDFGS